MIHGNKAAPVGAAAKVCYSPRVREFEKLTPAKREADEKGYKKGLQDGFGQGVWMMIALAGVIAFLFSMFPD